MRAGVRAIGVIESFVVVLITAGLFFAAGFAAGYYVRERKSRRRAGTL
jgi:hypothetical protein